MGFLEIFLIGVGLSMDAFAVSLCKGLQMPKLRWKDALLIGLFFGGFQAIMPLLGWTLGSQFERYIVEMDHWIAFLLLAFIGGKMIFDAVHEKEEVVEEAYSLKIRELLLLAIATSIDALAVGISFAFLQVNIWVSILVIGCTTLLISIGGVLIGRKFGNRFQKKAAIIGGVVLILIGVKILLEHLGALPF